MKKHKKVFQAPCTADFQEIPSKVKKGKKRFCLMMVKIINKSFDEYAFKCLQLKLFSKGPSFSGGKFSKFKKHWLKLTWNKLRKKFAKSFIQQTTNIF